jgi:enoyl-CoA hydratase
MQNNVLHTEITAGVAVVTLNRPDKLNALNAELLEALEATFRMLQGNEDVRAVVITGSGPKAFAAGADISELSSQNAHSGKIFAERGQRVFSLIERLGIPVIAAVNGFALGGGCELAMACHIRFASDNARFGQPEINLGIIPGYGGTQRLPRLVGMAKATELILSGEMIDAQEAHRLGLVNRIYPHAELLEKTHEFATGLAAKAPLALRACLEATQIAGDTSLLEGLHAEASVFGRTCGTEDFAEGTQAFLEKRPASFTGK